MLEPSIADSYEVDRPAQLEAGTEPEITNVVLAVKHVISATDSRFSNEAFIHRECGQSVKIKSSAQ